MNDTDKIIEWYSPLGESIGPYLLGGLVLLFIYLGYKMYKRKRR